MKILTNLMPGSVKIRDAESNRVTGHVTETCGRKHHIVHSHVANNSEFEGDFERDEQTGDPIFATLFEAMDFVNKNEQHFVEW